MPKSRIRQKSPYTPPPRRSLSKRPPRAWVAPTMVALFLVGLVWIVLFYVAGSYIPGMRDLGNLNLFIGFAFVAAGFGVATQWR